MSTGASIEAVELSTSELCSFRLSHALRASLAGRETRGLVVSVKPTDEPAPAALDALRGRLRLQAALHPGLVIELSRGGERERFEQPTGLPGLLGQRVAGQPARLATVARFTASAPCETGGELRAEVAIQWLSEGEGEVQSVVNDEVTPAHGTPLLGFVAGMSKALEEEGLDRDLLHYGMPALTKRRVLAGVVATLRLDHPEPLYSSPSRSALASRDAGPLFERLAYRMVRSLCSEQPGLIEALLTRALGQPVGKQAERRQGSQAELRP